GRPRVGRRRADGSAGGRRAPVSTGAGRLRVGRRRADGSAGGRRAVRADGRAAKGRAPNGRARRADRPSTGPARANGRAPGVRGPSRSLLRRRALLARGGALGRGLLLGRALRALLGELLDRDLPGDLLDLLGRAQRDVRGAVGDVRAETAVLDHDRLLAGGIGAELLQRGLGRGPAPRLGLGVDLLRLLEGDREDLLLRLQGARVGALLHVRAVAAVLGGDLGAVRRSAHHAGQAQQRRGVLEGDGGEVHRLQQRAGARLGLLRRRHLLAIGRLRLRQHLGDVRAVAAVLGDDLVTRLGIGAQHAPVVLAALEHLLRLLDGQLVRRDLVRDVRAARIGALDELAVLVPGELLDVGAVPAHPQRDALTDLDAVDRAGVDLAQVVDHGLEPDRAVGAVGEVEVLQVLR